MLRKNRKAWAHYAAQSAWYRKAVAWWIVSAKREATRQVRFATLVAESAAGRTVPPLTRVDPRKAKAATAKSAAPGPVKKKAK